MGCASSKPDGRNLDEVEVVFFDLDDTLYQNNWATAERLKKSIERYTVDELGLDEDYAFQLYLEHGTALRGLLKMKHLPEEKIEHYLADVHNVSLEEVTPNPELAAVIARLAQHKKLWIFTASTKEHAQRCLRNVGIDEGLFEGIIDCRSVGLVTKHSPVAFIQAMEIANVTEGGKCMFFDDSVKNIRTAKELGWHTCSVGLTRGTDLPLNCPEADFAVVHVVEIPQMIPALFDGDTDDIYETQVAPAKMDEYDLDEPVADEEEEEDDDEDEEEEEEEDEDIEEILEEGAVESEVPESEPRLAIFVLGGPGCGKGTQSQKLAKNRNVVHLSAGDLLRAELSNPDSEYGEVIDRTIKEGGIVPEEITMKLIVKAFKDYPDTRTFLIDGCPRDLSNLRGWYKYVQDPGHAVAVGALFYDTSEEVMLERILARANASKEQRVDDNEATARKRFQTFRELTMPLMDELRKDGIVRDIDASRPVEEVFQDTLSALDGLLEEVEA